MEQQYWHFLPRNGRARWGRHGKIEVGRTLSIKAKPVMCERGFHASERAIDSLAYAPGPVACLVTLGGEIVEDTDKVVAQERTVVAMADASMVLHAFACHEAELALQRERKEGREPAAASWEAIKVKRRWLKGMATDQELNAAESAAWSAAESAAWSAAWNAARSAAWSTAWSAAESVAESAAWSAAGSRQNRYLERKLRELLNG